MSRLVSAAVLLAALMGAAGPARADRFVPETTYKPSPQWWAAELKFGPYKPDIDGEFGGGAEPYKDVFGSGVGLMSQLTVDLQFFKKHGTLGVGGTIGFFRIEGHSLTDTGEASSDKTSLNIMPLVLQLVYRWDYAAKNWGVPLVPYVRAGLVWAIWWITDGQGDTASFDESGEQKARGGTFGYQINVGLALQLDFLEPTSAKKMDMEMGINHSYLFVEFVHSGIDDFGSDKRMQLGMKYGLLAGITLEF